MDDLIAASDGLELNIVATPAPTGKLAPVKAKKKTNKYERRRNKAARKRIEKLGLKLVRKPVAVKKETKNTTEATTTTTTKASTQENDNGEDKATTTKVEVNDEGEKVEGEDTQAAKNEHRNIDDDQNNNKHKTDTLQDLEERAKYMAEFHARPLELDRRSGVRSKKIFTSKDSSHLFDPAVDWPADTLHPRILSTLKAQNLDRPTLVQSLALSAFFAPTSDNILIHSETGSGKTLAYFIPILQSLSKHSQSSRAAVTRCVILCPTRELAVQTGHIASEFCQKTFHWMVCGMLLGEEKRKSEKARLRKGLGIVVATPGRFLDHLTRTECLRPALDALEWIVLDEADRLLDMGLGDQVKKIVDGVRTTSWRCVLVSATVTPQVKDLAHQMLLGGTGNWVKVRATRADHAAVAEEEDDQKKELAESTPRQLVHHHLMVTAKLRLAALVSFLLPRHAERTVVFMDTCASVDFHHALFSKMNPLLEEDETNEQTTPSPRGLFGPSCTILKLHGNVPHSERQHVLRRFLKDNSGGGAILLATDVAARGLNLPNVDWTVQYDPPSEVSDYVHRAGRVARAGKAGHSLIFLLPSEKLLLEVLQQRGIRGMQALSLTNTLHSASKCCPKLTVAGVKHAGGGRSSTASQEGEAFGREVQRQLEDFVLQDVSQTKKGESSSGRKRKKSAKSASSDETKQQQQLDTLLDLADKAFLSHLRAYPTREKAVRHIFAAKSLHLGHIARSFALREPPSRLANKKRRVVLGGDAGNHTNSTLRFGGGQQQNNPTNKALATADGKSALFENATRLQSNGMDAF